MVSQRTLLVSRCTWYDRPEGGWAWDGYSDTTPAGAILQAIACGSTDVTVDDMYATFIDMNTHEEIDGHTGEVIDNGGR